jgi:hypothetical protein
LARRNLDGLLYFNCFFVNDTYLWLAILTDLLSEVIYRNIGWWREDRFQDCWLTG